jgi:hypothetical protein
MSITTSRPNSWRKSSAMSVTNFTASGSSPFTWKIGASIIFATSVAYMDERPSSGKVVNPIWLFTTTCTVPPVL